MGDLKKTVEKVVESGCHIPNDNDILEDVLDEATKEMQDLNSDAEKK